MPRCLIPLFTVILFLCSPEAFFPEESRIATHFERIGPFGGDVRSLLVDSKREGVALLGTSDGRIYKTSDSGRSWIPLNPGIGSYEYVIDTLVQHPIESDHIYAGAWDLHSNGGGLFESKDAGLTWTRIILPQGSSAIRGFAICKASPKYMIAGTLSGAYISADGGRSWKHVGGSDLEKAESVAIDPKDYRSLYVGTWRLGYKSSDFGKTWTRIDKGMPLDSDLFSIAINPRNPEIIYASACSGVYRSSNRASSWTRMKLLPDRFTVRAQAVYMDPADPQKIYVGTTEGLFFSPNDGGNWVRLTPADVTVNAIQVDPNNIRRILIGTEYNGVLLSEDGGQKWEEVNAGFVHRQISWMLPNPRTPGQFFGGLQSGAGGFLLYDSKSRSWAHSQIEPGMRIFSFLVLPEDQGVLAGTSEGIYRQANINGPWQKLAGLIGRRAIYSLEIDSAGLVIYAGTDQGIYKASLSAMDFRVPPSYRFSPKVWCIIAPKTPPNFIYAGTSLGLFRSRDKGTTWNVLPSSGLPDRVVIGSLAVSPLDPNHMFAGTSAGLFESKDGGTLWRNAVDQRMRVDIPSVIFLDGSGRNLLAANKSSGGVFYSTDSGENWKLIYSPGNESPVYCLAQGPENPSAIYLGTRSDGVYLLNLDIVRPLR
jgi:photosystem II stability/assembly factor-like uncharacterized protein